MDRKKRHIVIKFLEKVKKLLPLLILTLFLGCATVHHPIGMGSNKFSIGKLNKYKTDDSKSKFYFQLSLEQALDIITSTCFDLDIPIYYPLKDDSQQIIKIKSGNFVAKLGLDCGKEGTAGAFGPGSDLASGVLEINLEKVDNENISVEIKTLFSRTQSTGGQHSYTQNLYFESTGRNEIIVLDNLLKYEKSK